MDQLAAPRTTHRTVRWRWAGAGLLAAAVLAVGACESAGWPFLAAPMQRWLATMLVREVVFSEDPAQPSRVALHLLRGIDLRAHYVRIGAPRWSSSPHMMVARDAYLELGYADLWRARGGGPLRLHELRARHIDGHIERLADGRASWQFGTRADTPDAAQWPASVPEIGRLQVEEGTMTYRDDRVAADLKATFATSEGAGASAPAASAAGFRLQARGTYRKLPAELKLTTPGLLPALADDARSRALPIRLAAHIGGAALDFDGTATDVLRLTELKGRFSVQGPSLAAAGDLLRVTLPTTGAFRAHGSVAKQGVVWNIVAERADIGASRLSGAFTFDPRPKVPMLAGRLTGTNLLLADLGPAVGAPERRAAANAAQAAASAAAPAPAPAPLPARRATKTVDSRAKPVRVLPDRPFDLPALRAMDANILIDIDTLDLGSKILEPLKPLRTHLVLGAGVLTLRELEARSAGGQLDGTVQLEGREGLALWTADLRWSGVRLERWVHQTRAADAPPYVTGNLDGQARVAGQGRSTAAILASLRGGVRMQLVGGTVSHLAIEAAGLDIAQGLGVLVKGDDALPVQCTVADLVAERGVLRPRVLVLETRDSTLWIDGSLSLASEALDLSVVVSPKDFSPMTLRTPVHVRGTFSDPRVVLDKGRLGARLGAAALLGLVNPLAALIPLVDVGGDDDAKRGMGDCRSLASRFGGHTGLPMPAASASSSGR